MSNKDEIAALKKKVEELDAKLSPPKPFVPEPYLDRWHVYAALGSGGDGRGRARSHDT
jgi:hypothetical protein